METFMRAAKSFLIASTILATTPIAARADIQVVASIKPVHSLVAAVMSGVGEPGLIVEGAGSPHAFSMRPSQAVMLENADVVFWIGHDLEAFLEKPLEALASNAKSVELIKAHGLVKLDLREGGTFDAHDHGEHEAHEDHDHDDHAHEKHDDHAHDQHDEFNVHIWVDPVNAKALVHEIEETLVEADPDNAPKYKANANDITARLDAMTAEIAADLETVKDKPFVVFHDAYRNFEDRFGLTAAGSITVSPEVQPGAERVSELRTKISELGATCVFSEPQFEPKIVQIITENTSAKSGILDPLGTSLQDGPDLYFELIRNMATSFKTCLSESS